MLANLANINGNKYIFFSHFVAVQRREYHGALPDVHGEAEVDVGLHVVGKVRDSVPRKVRGRGGRQVPHLTQVVSVTFSRRENFGFASFVFLTFIT